MNVSLISAFNIFDRNVITFLFSTFIYMNVKVRCVFFDDRIMNEQLNERKSKKTGWNNDSDKIVIEITPEITKLFCPSQKTKRLLQETGALDCFFHPI